LNLLESKMTIISFSCSWSTLRTTHNDTRVDSQGCQTFQGFAASGALVAQCASNKELAIALLVGGGAQLKTAPTTELTDFVVETVELWKQC
jgi:hypothetical protein